MKPKIQTKTMEISLSNWFISRQNQIKPLLLIQFRIYDFSIQLPEHPPDHPIIYLFISF